jgi:hypothetical protein
LNWNKAVRIRDVTEDELYQQATGQLPAAAVDGDLSDDHVRTLVARYAGQDVADALATRFEPQDGQPHPGDRVFVTPVKLLDGKFLALAWMFGQPDPDEVRNWKVRWHSVRGPLSLDELKEFARAVA